jgi:hypothetical protein
MHVEHLNNFTTKTMRAHFKRRQDSAQVSMEIVTRAEVGHNRVMA